MAALRSEIHLVVNPDIVVSAGCVRAVADVLRQRKDVTLVGPRVVSPDGALYRSCKLLPTPWNLFARRFAPRQLYAAADARYELEAFGYDRELRLHNLSGPSWHSGRRPSPRWAGSIPGISCTWRMSISVAGLRAWAR